MTGTVLCHAGVRVVVSSFSGLVTGGLVANVRITKPCGKIVGVPITRSTTILVPLEQRTSELIIPGASGVGGASILGDWIAVIANLEGLVCGDE